MNGETQGQTDRQRKKDRLVVMAMAMVIWWYRGSQEQQGLEDGSEHEAERCDPTKTMER